MSRSPLVAAAIIRARNNDGATACENARVLAAEVERLEKLLARLRAVEAQVERLESAVSKSRAEIIHNCANDLRRFADKLEGKQS